MRMSRTWGTRNPVLYIHFHTQLSQHPWELDAHFTDGETEAEQRTQVTWQLRGRAGIPTQEV